MNLFFKYFFRGESPGGARVIAAVLILFFLFRAFDAANKKSITYDEVAHIPAGYLYVLTGDYSVNPEHPPLCKILSGLSIAVLAPSIPEGHLHKEEIDQWRFGSDFFRKNSAAIDKIIFTARLPHVLLGALLGILVWLWSSEMYGKKAGLASLFFYSFCPNFLAHSPLANTDVGGAVFIFLTMFMVYRFYVSKNEKFILYAGVSFGLALAAKFTAPVVLIPSFFMIVFHRVLAGGNLKKFDAYLFKILLAGAVSIVVLALFYGFYNLQWYFTGIQEVFTQTGVTGWQNYLNGRFSEEGFRSYYAFAFLFKTPVAFMVLLAWAFSRRIKRKEMFLLYPVLILFIIASFSRKQIGLRYILAVYPFLYVFSGRLFSYKPGSLFLKKLKASCVFFLLAWLAFSSLRYHPSYIAYFNEIAGGPENGHLHLLDSNIDWGQDLKELKEYIEKEGRPELVLAYFGNVDPAVYGIEHQPLFPVGSYTEWVNAGAFSREYLAVNLNHLYGLYLTEDFFAWLRPVEPIAKIGYSIYVYDITKDISARNHLYDSYVYMGFEAAARREKAIIKVLSGD